MYLIYNLLLVIFYPLFQILQFFVPKLRKVIVERENDLKKLLDFPFEKNRKVVWFHAASVGELDQSRAIAKTLKEKNNFVFILQSVYSSSVTTKQLEDSNFDLTFHLPFDFPFSYDKIIRKFQPDVLMILAWDTWPNLIRNLKKAGAKTYLACASLSESSSRNKGLSRMLTKATFRNLDGIFPSHEILTPYFKPLVSEKTPLISLGDTRFDAVLNRIETNKPNDRFLDFVKKYNLHFKTERPILFGSTYPICENNLLGFLEKNKSETSNFWIFPHKWEADRMSTLSKELERYGSVGNFSNLVDQQGEYPRFLLFDEMGILAFAYQFARFAYVGGGFHHRIHNTIEPAAFGLALLTGSKISNAPEAIVMQKLGGLFVCQNEEDFSTRLSVLLSDQTKTQEIGEKNRKFVLENRGASERIYLKVFSDALS
jgi:3-deoxy-D-manno-octulosonic-acid transferase